MYRELIKKEDLYPQRMVFAEVYAPNIPDTDGEFMDSETIRKMAYQFMRDLKLEAVDTQHDNQCVKGVSVVESFIARKGDPDFIEGSWVAGVHVSDDHTWGRIMSGEINGFSMEALVSKVPMELEIELPPVIKGMCIKHADGHDHEFFVTYDPDGNLVGGRTSSAPDGHWHIIKRGTLTEMTGGHQHRFSFVEAFTLAP